MTLLVCSVLSVMVLGAICFGQLLRLQRYEQYLAAQDEELHRLRRELKQEQRRRYMAEAISAYHTQQLLAANSGLVLQYRNWKRTV